MVVDSRRWVLLRNDEVVYSSTKVENLLFCCKRFVVPSLFINMLSCLNRLIIHLQVSHNIDIYAIGPIDSTHWAPHLLTINQDKAHGKFVSPSKNQNTSYVDSFVHIIIGRFSNCVNIHSHRLCICWKIRGALLRPLILWDSLLLALSLLSLFRSVSSYRLTDLSFSVGTETNIVMKRVQYGTNQPTIISTNLRTRVAY